MSINRRNYLRIQLCLVLTALCAAPIFAADASSGKLTVTFLELKAHGLAVVLQTPNGKTYIIDAGLKEKDYDAGRDTIAPYLKTNEIKHIDGIAISHSHGDHYGGSPWLIDNYPVKQFIDNGYDGRGQTDVYRAIRKQAKERGGEHIVAHAGQRLEWDKDLEVEVMSPPKEFLLQDSDPAKVTEHAVLNNNSLTLRIRHGKNIFLFPGDAYGSENNYMVKNNKPETLRTTILCAPHHGFNSTPAYAEIVKPEVVVASCIKFYQKSPIPSPADHAAMIYGPVGSKVYASPWHGTIQVISDGTSYQVKTDREKADPKK